MRTCPRQWPRHPRPRNPRPSRGSDMIMRTNILPCAAWTLYCACAALPAQSPLTAKSFLPSDYRNVVYANLAAMRDKGIWDELEASVLKAVFQQMEKEAGFELRALDR